GSAPASSRRRAAPRCARFVRSWKAWAWSLQRRTKRARCWSSRAATRSISEGSTMPASGVGTMIVTGASTGIGAAIARTAGSAGYRVALTYKSDTAGAEAVARDIVAAGGEALVVQADVSRESDVLALFEQVDARFGAPDVLVNNAGAVGPLCRVEEI